MGFIGNMFKPKTPSIPPPPPPPPAPPPIATPAQAATRASGGSSLNQNARMRAAGAAGADEEVAKGLVDEPKTAGLTLLGGSK